MGSVIDLLPEGTKPLPKPMLNYNQQDGLVFILGLF